MDPFPADRVRRVGREARAGLVLAAIGLTVVLGVARWLKPDPRGYGTHVQLGLLPCAFATLTGRPCPSCGMTTAFAWMVRGRFYHAWRANPAGSLLVPTCVLLIPWLLISAAIGRPWGFRSFDRPLTLLVVAIVALSLVAWTFRLFLGRAL
jgi:hypothetical protein